MTSAFSGQNSINLCPASFHISRPNLPVTPGVSWASLVAQMVKGLSAMQETWVQSLGWEDPLEKEMSAHSSIIAWKIPWTDETGRLQFMRPQNWTPLSD